MFNSSFGIESSLLSSLEQRLQSLEVHRYSYTTQSSRASIVDLSVSGGTEELEFFIDTVSLPVLSFPIVTQELLSQQDLVAMKESVILLTEELLDIPVDNVTLGVRAYTGNKYQSVFGVDVSDIIYCYLLVPLSSGSECYIRTTDIIVRDISKAIGYTVIKGSSWLSSSLELMPQGDMIRTLGSLLLVPKDMEEQVRDFVLMDESSCSASKLEDVLSLPELTEQGSWIQLVTMMTLDVFLLRCELPYDTRIKWNTIVPSLYYYSVKQFFNISRSDPSLIVYRDAIRITERGVIIVPLRDLAQLNQYTIMVQGDLSRNEQWYTYVLESPQELMGTRMMIYSSGYSSIARYNGTNYLLVTNCPEDMRRLTDYVPQDEEELLGMKAIKGLCDGMF